MTSASSTSGSADGVAPPDRDEAARTGPVTAQDSPPLDPSNRAGDAPAPPGRPTRWWSAYDSTSGPQTASTPAHAARLAALPTVSPEGPATDPLYGVLPAGPEAPSQTHVPVGWPTADEAVPDVAIDSAAIGEGRDHREEQGSGSEKAEEDQSHGASPRHEAAHARSEQRAVGTTQTTTSGEAPRETATSPQRPTEALPRPIGPLLAVLRHPILALLPVVLILGLGVIDLVQRTPVYTAEAQVLVGRVDVEANAIPGFVNATQQLAATYARLVSTTVIAERVSEELDVPLEVVVGHLAGDPVPESSLIRISTTASTEDMAVLLAETTSDELVAYLQETNDNPSRRQALLEEYELAAAELQAAELERAAAEAALAAAEPSNLAERQAAVAGARAAVDRATLRVNAAARAYNDSQRGAADRGILQTVSRAESQGDNRLRRLQLVIALALIVGGLLGSGMALARANRGVLRDLRRRVASGR